MNPRMERHSTVVCLQDGKALFVRKAAPEWSLPGGKIDEQEHYQDAARRELREETSLPFNNAEFLGHHVFDNEEHYLYKMDVPASVLPLAASEIVECRWFAPLELRHVMVKRNNRELLELAGAGFE